MINGLNCLPRPFLAAHWGCLFMPWQSWLIRIADVAQEVPEPALVALGHRQLLFSGARELIIPACRAHSAGAAIRRRRRLRERLLGGVFQRNRSEPQRRRQTVQPCPTGAARITQVVRRGLGQCAQDGMRPWPRSTGFWVNAHQGVLEYPGRNAEPRSWRSSRHENKYKQRATEEGRRALYNERSIARATSCAAG
jgi:hypothetical protein